MAQPVCGMRYAVCGMRYAVCGMRYAVCEGICRRLRQCRRDLSMVLEGERLETLAAKHVATFLDLQRRNVETLGGRGVFFTYEAMCAEPERVTRKIRDLAPELDDLHLRRRLRVHSNYHEMLTDMNARQIAAINAVLGEHRTVLNYFGYDIMEGVPTRECPICGTSSSFLDAGRNDRTDARCGRCGSLERHRLIWCYLERTLDIRSFSGKMLDVSPATSLASRRACFWGEGDAT